jgi:UDP-N-acetylglucosamine--N-acetylmuramyl-(pentapeptide) pyrophosphoryl-undecaprenol N-acetylglucosamine transferase
VTPGIALAGALEEEGDSITFVGTSAGAEARLVPGAGFELEVIDVRGFDRSQPWRLPSVGWRAARALGQARAILGRVHPDVVVGMGGYVSLPVCLAARSRRAPVVVHEQNVVLGLANRVSRPLAAAVAVSFAETLPDAGPRGVLVGNPVRADIAGVDLTAARAHGLERFGLDPGRRTLLVFGGSQGARRINEAAAGLARLWAGRSDLQIVHIAGRAHAPALEVQVERHTRAGRLVYRVLDYVDHMAEAYAVADLALCRGGASTVVELAAVGLPALIVPYPHHRDRQQERLGRALERAGAARVIDDSSTTSERVAGEVDALFDDAERLGAMRTAARAFARPDAARDLARVVRRSA